MEHLKLLSRGIKAVMMPPVEEGFEHETNDCMVTAIQAVTGVPYRDAHEFVRVRFHRQDRKGTMATATGMMNISVTKAIVFGYRVFTKDVLPVGQQSRVSTDSYGHRTRYTRPRYETLAQFVKSHRTGRLLVWSNNHAFAIIDGTVYDNGAAGARIQITGCFEFIPSSVVEKGTL
jgi:hypothetical protein